MSGRAASLDLVFALGIAASLAAPPAAADIDAVHLVSTSPLVFYFSLEGDTEIDGAVYSDDDIVLVDLSAAGFPSANDVDGLHVVVALFADGFESGDISAWSATVP